MSTVTEKNEAAERLRQWFQNPDTRSILDEALAAERRATVERIRAAALSKRKAWGAEGLPSSLAAILDEEAAR